MQKKTTFAATAAHEKLDCYIPRKTPIAIKSSSIYHNIASMRLILMQPVSIAPPPPSFYLASLPLPSVSPFPFATMPFCSPTLIHNL